MLRIESNALPLKKIKKVVQLMRVLKRHQLVELNPKNQAALLEYLKLMIAREYICLRDKLSRWVKSLIFYFIEVEELTETQIPNISPGQSRPPLLSPELQHLFLSDS